MPNFEGRGRIVLQPNDVDVPYRFEIPIATAVDSNDGAIPYGDTVDSVDVTAYDSADTDVTAQMVGSATTGDDYFSVPLTYPSTGGNGRYKLTFVVTTANGVEKEFDFERVVALDH